MGEVDIGNQTSVSPEDKVVPNGSSHDDLSYRLPNDQPAGGGLDFEDERKRTKSSKEILEESDEGEGDDPASPMSPMNLYKDLKLMHRRATRASPGFEDPDGDVVAIQNAEVSLK